MRTALSSPCMFLASTPAVTSIGPSPSSGSHHEETWLGLGPPDVSPFCHEGGSGTTLWTRRPKEATRILQACVVAWPGVAWHGGVLAEGSNPKPKTKPPCKSYGLVQATAGVGTVLIWDLF